MCVLCVSTWGICTFGAFIYFFRKFFFELKNCRWSPLSYQCFTRVVWWKAIVHRPHVNTAHMRVRTHAVPITRARHQTISYHIISRTSRCGPVPNHYLLHRVKVLSVVVLFLWFFVLFCPFTINTQWWFALELMGWWNAFRCRYFYVVVSGLGV